MITTSTSPVSNTSVTTSVATPAPKKRGRPPKNANKGTSTSEPTKAKKSKSENWTWDDCYALIVEVGKQSHLGSDMWKTVMEQLKNNQHRVCDGSEEQFKRKYKGKYLLQ